MQIDTWLTETPYPECCPLCSQPLDAGAHRCLACGFQIQKPARTSQQVTPAPRQINPVTPIPPRASAHRISQSLPGNTAQQTSTQTPGRSFPTASSGGVRHQSPNYEAASSLNSLSLIISETPTVPPRMPHKRTPKETGALAHIDEIDTLPPPFAPQKQSRGKARKPESTGSRQQKTNQPDVATTAHAQSTHIDEIDTLPERGKPFDEIDTLPERGKLAQRAETADQVEAQLPAVDATSWVASSTRAKTGRRRATNPGGQKRRQQERFHMLDHLRWWLLRPGHIEFLLWLFGSILLLGITLLLLLATVLSIHAPQATRWGNFPNSATVNATSAAHPASAMSLQILGKPRLMPGSEFQLHGQGFQPYSQVAFLLDDRWPLLDQHNHAASLQVDGSGSFTVNLWLGDGSVWSAGPHQIQASETSSSKQISTPITIASGPIARATEPPNNTGTGSSSQQPTPVLPTPTPVPPTPTPVPPTPTAEPTATATVPPEPSPTAISTPVTPAINTTPGVNTTPGAPALSSALNNNGDSSLFGRLAGLNPLVWLIVACYILSMILLGLAGLLRHRRPAKKE